MAQELQARSCYSAGRNTNIHGAWVFVRGYGNGYAVSLWRQNSQGLTMSDVFIGALRASETMEISKSLKHIGFSAVLKSTIPIYTFPQFCPILISSAGRQHVTFEHFAVSSHVQTCWFKYCIPIRNYQQERTHKQTSTQTETKRAIATLIKDIRGLVFSFVFLEAGLSLKKIRKFPSTCCPKDASLTSCHQSVQVNFEAQQKVRSQALLMGKFMHKLG